MAKDLKKLREELDSIDQQIVELLNQRAARALEVREAKKHENLQVYAPERELQILERVTSLATTFPAGPMQRVFTNILSATRSLVGELKVAYLAPDHSISHAAALKQFGEHAEYLLAANIEEVFLKIEEGEASCGVVPARLSSAGLVTKTFDRLLRSNIKIVAEVELVAKTSGHVGGESEVSESRCLVVGDIQAKRTGRDKTSLVCSLADKAGALREILEPFSKNGVTLLKIESRPVKDRNSEFLFYLDLAGHTEDLNVSTAISELSKMCQLVKNIGSYPFVCHS
jgi:chorismate mutase